MFKELKAIKGKFIPPNKRYYLGEAIYGTPYMQPSSFNGNIVTIRKNKRTYERNYNFNLWGYNIAIGWPIYFHFQSLGWKDKWDSPRHEWDPAFHIFFFKWQFVMWYSEPNDAKYNYWEMVLWCLYYSGGDVDKARDTWGWIDSTTRESTWNDDYVIK